jgi:hypothetical protein
VPRKQLHSTQYGHFCAPSVSLCSYILWKGVTLCYVNSCGSHSMVTSVLHSFSVLLHSLEGSNTVLHEQLQSLLYGHFSTPSISHIAAFCEGE